MLTHSRVDTCYPEASGQGLDREFENRIDVDLNRHLKAGKVKYFAIIHPKNEK